MLTFSPAVHNMLIVQLLNTGLNINSVRSSFYVCIRVMLYKAFQNTHFLLKSFYYYPRFKGEYTHILLGFVTMSR